MVYSGIDPASGNRLDVSVENGFIAKAEASTAPAAGLPYLSRGFIDMQVNGYRGNDYSREDLDRHRIEAIVNSLAAAGTTSHVATIVTRPQSAILRSLRVIAAARRASPLIAAAVAGIHIEGPFISSEEGPRGAHDPRYVRDPDFAEFQEWQDAAEGLVKVVTVAPEREGSLAFIQKVAATGCVVAIGHSAAQPERIREAIAAGCTLSTHLGNGSHATLPRLKNYLWEQLASDELSAGIIADGFHLPASVLRVIARAKGLGKLILVSDAAAPAGLEPGPHRWGNLEVELFPDGRIGLAGTPFLAGAGHLLDWDIPMFMRCTGASLAEAIGLCTANPARLLSLGRCDGSPQLGARADLTLFRLGGGGEKLLIEKTLISGEVVFSA